MINDFQVNPKIIQALVKQQQDMVKKSPPGVKIILNDLDVLDIQADIQGPEGTPFESGVFRCKLLINENFPQAPPKGYFLTKIFHPNISEKGEICVNSLKKDWNPLDWSLYNIFEVIKCLLIIPFPESALNEEAGKLFMENYEEFCQHARIITEIHAIKNEAKINSSSKNCLQEQFAQEKIEKVTNFEDGESPLNPLTNQVLKKAPSLTQQSSNKKENEKKWLKRI